MRRLKRFVALDYKERAIFLRALTWLAAVRVALKLFPFRVVQRMISARGKAPADVTPSQPDLDRILWAVKAASRYVPGATCLPQALVAQALLSRSNYPSRLEIGVTKNEQRNLVAHAWVVCQGQIVIGGPEVAIYTLLAGWEERS